ncbi:MAG: ComEC/Rec2 family competence protein [Paludibacteraceae bacterium]|nr:ComEC/Rec2 family competence protein [Paludibacteraceae bacterium]
MKDFALRTPFFRLFLAYAAGILLFTFCPFSGLSIFLFCFACLFLLFHYYKINDIHFELRWLFGCGVFFLFIALGMYASQRNENQIQFKNLNQAGVFQVEINSVPVEKPKSYLVKVRTIAFAKDSVRFIPTHGNAMLYLSKSTEANLLNIGDKLLVSATFEPLKPNGNPEEFNYAEYLHRKGFGASCFVDSTHWVLLERNKGFSITRMASDCRNRLLNIYKACHIQGDEFAVLAALTLGYQDEISDDLYTSYSNSGAIHILSVSGLHVGIVYVIFAFLLSFLDKSDKTRFVKSALIILLLWAYAFITGLSPCVMRSALMFSLVAFGSVFRYKSQLYNTIFFSAFVLLLINPNYLFDVSFLLSYVAVISIVWFTPLLKGLLWFKNKVFRWCWELFCVSVAAQVGTFPLCIYYFHKFPNHFLLTNFIAIPISTGIIYLAVLLFVVFSIPVIGSWVGIALKWLLIAQNRSIVFIDHLPYSTFHTWINQWEVLLFYCVIVGFWLFAVKKRPVFLFAVLGCLLLIQGLHFYRHSTSLGVTQLVVYNNKQCTAVDFIAQGRHQLFTTDSIKTKRMAEAFWLKENLADPECVQQAPNYRDGFISFAGKHIYILTDSTYRYKKTERKIKLDYLILGNKAAVSIPDIENVFEVKNIIVNNTFSKFKVRKIQQECRTRGIACYATSEGGAYIHQL